MGCRDAKELVKCSQTCSSESPTPPLLSSTYHPVLLRKLRRFNPHPGERSRKTKSLEDVIKADTTEGSPICRCTSTPRNIHRGRCAGQIRRLAVALAESYQPKRFSVSIPLSFKVGEGKRRRNIKPPAAEAE